MPTDFSNEFPSYGDLPSGYPSGGNQSGGDFSFGGSGNQNNGGFFSNPTNILALINTAIGLFGGMRQADMSNEQREMIEERVAAARGAASAENFAGIVARLTPMFREVVAAGLGPAFQESVSRTMAKRGLTGTGVGAAFSNASAAMPNIMAFQSAMGEAGRIQEGQIGAELGAPIPGPRMDPFTTALVTGARAFFGTTASSRNESNSVPRPDEQELFPNLSRK